jgi:hypothetical protein
MPAPKKCKYTSESRKCKYCHLAFMTKPTYAGSKQKFCKPAHRKAFFDEGKQPIDVIMKRQEKRMRAIAKEEAEKAVRALALQCGLFDQRPVIDNVGKEAAQSAMLNYR